MIGLIITLAFFYLAFSKESHPKLILKEESQVQTFEPFHISNHNLFIDTSFISKNIDEEFNFDTTDNELIVSDESKLENPYLVDLEEKKVIKKVYSGKRINIAVTGVDSRLGERYRHADANHIISLIIDKGEIEIYSIPRDTYADAGYDINVDTLDRFNIIANVLGKLGRKTYLKELERIAQIDHIHYYVELGFSQAIGIIEKLGFNDANSTLRTLRDRKSYRIGDYQRSYNQGKFIKGSILKLYDLSNSAPDIIYDVFLSLVETNLSKSDLINFKNIFASIQKSNISNQLRPKLYTKLEEIDLFDSTVLDSIIAARSYKKDTTISQLVEKKLLSALANAELQNSHHIRINKLKRLFEQRAWLQISDSKKRFEIKNRFKDILYQSYLELGKLKEAQKVIGIDYN